MKGELVARDAASAIVRKLGRDVSCSHANGNLCVFAVGQQMEMHCHLREAQFRIEYVKNEHTKVVLQA